jgi:hypothetical protein
VDLLDMTTARALTRRAAGQNTADDEIDDYTRDAGGRMVIKVFALVNKPIFTLRFFNLSDLCTVARLYNIPKLCLSIDIMMCIVVR